MAKAKITWPAVPGVTAKSAAIRGSRPSQMRRAAPLKKLAMARRVTAAPVSAAGAWAVVGTAGEGTGNPTTCAGRPRRRRGDVLRGRMRGRGTMAHHEPSPHGTDHRRALPAGVRSAQRAGAGAGPDAPARD